MSKRFEPSSGFYRHEASFGGWTVRDNNRKALAFVPLHPGQDLWQTECDAMLLAGGPEMLDTLVRAHNCLNNIPGAHDPAMIARKVQGSIRGGLVKVIGSSERLTGAGIILPSGVIYEEGPEVFDRG